MQFDEIRGDGALSMAHCVTVPAFDRLEFDQLRCGQRRLVGCNSEPPSELTRRAKVGQLNRSRRPAINSDGDRLFFRCVLVQDRVDRGGSFGGRAPRRIAPRTGT